MSGFGSILGIDVSEKVSYILNRFDVIGVGLTIARFGYLYFLKFGFSITLIIEHPWLTLCLILAISLNLISEYDKYSRNLKWMYIPIHCLWHISIFVLMDRFYLLF